MLFARIRANMAGIRDSADYVWVGVCSPSTHLPTANKYADAMWTLLRVLGGGF